MDERFGDSAARVQLISFTNTSGEAPNKLLYTKPLFQHTHIYALHLITLLSHGARAQDQWIVRGKQVFKAKPCNFKEAILPGT